MLVNSLISSLDDHILHEVFVVISNNKMNLLKDLSPFHDKKIDSKYLKHRESENSKRISKNKIVRLPPAFSTPSPDAVQGDEDSYINYERLMNNDEPEDSLYDTEGLDCSPPSQSFFLPDPVVNLTSSL